LNQSYQQDAELHLRFLKQCKDLEQQLFQFGQSESKDKILE